MTRAILFTLNAQSTAYRISSLQIRGALYGKALISNLMFWYLGVINKTQQPQSQQQTQRQTTTERAQAVAGGSGPASQKEREEKERTELEQAENERDEAKLALQG